MASLNDVISDNDIELQRFSELEYLDAITLTIGRGDLGSGHMSSKISNTSEDSLDVSTDNETNILKNVSYVCCLDQKILHSCMMISCMEDFVKHVQIAY